MSDWEDTCASCGAYLDAMNSEVISGQPYGLNKIWCGEYCLDDWARAKQKKEEEP